VRQGLSNRAIAERLHITPGTAKDYLHEIYMTVGLQNQPNARLQLALAVERQGREATG
jgi:DNA-binding NarL/FixJ family response regulator